VTYRRAPRRSAALLFVVLAVLGTAPRASADVTEEERAAEVKVLKLINRGREAKGLKPLKEHEVIRTEAEGQSERMAKQQTLSHTGLEARQTRIANADSGIDPDQICENVASAELHDIHKAMKGIVKAWKGSEVHNQCMFDGSGYTTRSAGVGAIFSEGVWYVTFIAAHDETPDT
jgi:uncharacterized protein YkwD